MKWKMFLLAVIASISVGFGQTKEPKMKTVVIQTSAECGECEERLESNLNYLKGVVFAELDMTTMKLTVKYKTKSVTLDQIKKKISDLGYQADEVAANPEAYEKLPACCKANGMKE
jgi:periplasmic mercuric ion binding protein